jgi:hypothetical protein
MCSIFPRSLLINLKLPTGKAVPNKRTYKPKTAVKKIESSESKVAPPSPVKEEPRTQPVFKQPLGSTRQPRLLSSPPRGNMPMSNAGLVKFSCSPMDKAVRKGMLPFYFFLDFIIIFILFYLLSFSFIYYFVDE